MAECSLHPGVETNVRCVSCDHYICPRDYVTTPVGYKCPECAAQLPSARRAVKPRQWALAAAAASAAGVGGAFLLAALGFRFWLAAILLGLLTGEAARRGSGGHRTTGIAALAGLSVLAGMLLSGQGYISAGLGTLAAALYVVSGRR